MQRGSLFSFLSREPLSHLWRCFSHLTFNVATLVPIYLILVVRAPPVLFLTAPLTLVSCLITYCLNLLRGNQQFVYRDYVLHVENSDVC